MKEGLKPGMEVELAIERLGGLGDGVGRHSARDLFVPLTTPGDRVRVRITRVNNKMVRAELVQLLDPGPERVEPPCPHFGDCGGCELQHLAQERYRQFKRDMLRQAVARAGYDPALVAPVIVVPPGTRRRADFAVTAGGGSVRLGFRACGSHRIVPLAACPVLVPRLEYLMEPLRALIPSLTWGGLITGLIATAVENRAEILFELSSPPSGDSAALAEFAEHHDLARFAWRCGDFSGLLLERVPFAITWGGVAVHPPPGAFLQATAEGEAAITAEILASADGMRTAVDLYAGCGAFTLPLLAAGMSVNAYEGDGDMVASLNDSLTAKVTPGRGIAVRRDLFREPVTADELRNTELAVIDPPRNGAEPQIRELANARIPRIVLVSCNPRALERDGAILHASGYRLEKAVPIDQFLWSSHLEAVAVFSL